MLRSEIRDVKFRNDKSGYNSFVGKLSKLERTLNQYKRNKGSHERRELEKTELSPVAQ